MEMNEFVEKMANQFADEDIQNVKIDTHFRSLDSWDSLTGMAVMVMIQDEFDITLPVEEFIKANTPEELYHLIISKK
ncbi:MAG: acyl carrier protein [Breznakibacter sp.]